MIQQINLYQPMLRQPKRIFSALTILQIWSVVALALVVLTGFGQWRVGALAGRLTGLENPPPSRHHRSSGQTTTISAMESAARNASSVRRKTGIPASGEVSLSKPIRRLDPAATRMAEQARVSGVAAMRGSEFEELLPFLARRSAG